MILIDTNALIVLLLGLMDIRLINSHKTTSIYEEEDFHNLIDVISDIEKLVVLPNIWTEVDNLLNNFKCNYKYTYILRLADVLKKSFEHYIESKSVLEDYTFFDLGLTDSLLLQLAVECDFLITSDSRLSDYAIAKGVLVYDIVKERNKRLK